MSGNYKKLGNQPLKFALAEFRFNPILAIEDYIPKIQDALRGEFPNVGQRNDQFAEFNNQTNQISFSGVKNWSFTSQDRKSAVEINQGRLVYVTIDYPRFEAFSSVCEKALDVIARVVEPGHCLRIGLRYGDSVKPKAGDSLDQYVINSLLPAENVTEFGPLLSNRTETVVSTHEGVLCIRSLAGTMQFNGLEDVNAFSVKVNPDSEASERILLDFDHFVEFGTEAPEFAPRELIKTLGSLHETTREAFWKVTTDYAREQVWD